MDGLVVYLTRSRLLFGQDDEHSVGQVSTVLLEANACYCKLPFLVYSIQQLGYNLIPPLLGPSGTLVDFLIYRKSVKPHLSYTKRPKLSGAKTTGS